MKIIIVEINETFPDTELSKPTAVAIEGRNYTGTIRAIILGENATVNKVTLEGSALKVVPNA